MIGLYFHVTAQGLLMDRLDPEYQNNGILYTNQYANIEGSPFFGNGQEFIGEIEFEGGQTRTDIRLQYDMVRDLLMFIDEDKGPLVLDTKAIKKFTIVNGYGQDIHFVKMSVSGMSGFYQLLYSGVVSFYVKHKKEIVKSETKDSGYSTSINTKDKIREYVIYFLSDGNKTERLKKINSENVLKALSSFTIKNEQTKKKSLNLKKESDVIEFLKTLE